MESGKEKGGGEGRGEKSEKNERADTGQRVKHCDLRGIGIASHDS